MNELGKRTFLFWQLVLPSLKNSKTAELNLLSSTDTFLVFLPILPKEPQDSCIWGYSQKWEYQTTWPASWETYMQVRKQQLELDMEQQTGSK